METLTTLFTRFESQIEQGFGFLGADVNWLLTSLVILNITLSAFVWMNSDDQIIVQLARRVLFIGVMAWLVLNWPQLTDILAETFIRLGIKAGGGTLDAPGEIDPGAIAERGWAIAWGLFQATRDLSGSLSVFKNLSLIVLYLIAMVTIIVAFSVIALQVGIAILSFKLGTLITFILVPFGLLKPTAFIAERPLGWVVASSVRLMALTVVVGIGESVFTDLRPASEPPQIGEAFDTALAAVALMLLSLLASRFGTELVSGQPWLSGGDVATSIRTSGLASKQAVGFATRPFRGKR